MESSNRVVQNALNARLKTGDKVKVGFYPDAQSKGIVGKVGELLKIDPLGDAVVEIEGHEYLTHRAHLRAANARKPIKKGRFAGKVNGLEYYVDYTKDRWFASKYGKDGTNVTEIKVTTPYLKDADGRERKHILYTWASGREWLNDGFRHPDMPDAVARAKDAVRAIMRGPNVVRQGDEAFAWNSESVRAVNMSQRVKDLMYSAHDHLSELLIDLQYVRELIAKTEADENEDVKRELPKLDRAIEQARQMQRAWLRR